MGPGRGTPAIVIPAGSQAAQETAMMRGTAGMPPGKVAAGRLPELQLSQGSAPEKRSVIEVSTPPEIPAKPVLVAPALLD